MENLEIIFRDLFSKNLETRVENERHFNHFIRKIWLLNENKVSRLSEKMDPNNTHHNWTNEIKSHL